MAPQRILVWAATVGGVVEATIAWRLGLSALGAAYLLFGAASVVVSLTDVTERRIPNWVTLSLYVVGPFLLALATAISGRPWGDLGRAGLAMVALAGFYLALALAISGGVGMGDVKLAGLVGMYLGYLGWQAVVAGTLLGFMAASLFVLGHRVIRSRHKGILVPMAPFMVAGALAAILVVR